jgi:hypothetical protein
MVIPKEGDGEWAAAFGSTALLPFRQRPWFATASIAATAAAGSR